MEQEHVKAAKDFSKEVYKRMQYTYVSQMKTVLLTKNGEFVANIADFKNASYQEW